MLPTKENGDVITIENVFHSLNTRLNALKSGIIQFGDIYSGYEYGYNKSESINEIRKYIEGFEAAKALNATYYPLSLIGKIHELIENSISISVEPLPQAEESWPISQVNDFTQIKEELSYYESFLITIQDELLERIDSVGNTSSNNNKIKINITVEQLGALLYFLNNTRDFSSNNKVFNAELISLCRALSSILCLSNGDDFSSKSLKNNASSFKDNIECLNFWKEKFLSYVNQSYLLIRR